MAPEHRPPDREREIIVTDGGDRSGASAFLVALVAIVAIVLVGWLLLNVLGNDTDDPAVDIPTEFDVDIDDGSDDTGDDTGDEDTDPDS